MEEVKRKRGRGRPKQEVCKDNQIHMHMTDNELAELERLGERLGLKLISTMFDEF